MKLKFWQSDPYDDLASGLQKVRGDADVLALLPYDDGTFWMKPANFDKELIGGQGGYETEDGDKIVLDGDGEPVKNLLGVDIVLGIDPTEHAGAVEPVKAMMAQKNNVGEWLKVDRQGEIIEAGEALMPAPTSDVDFDDVGAEGTVVEERAAEIAAQRQIHRDQAIEYALEELEKEGEVTKIFDLAPPAGIGENEDGQLELEEATHIAVDQSKASDLMPTTTSTVELNTALDKARMEEYEEGKLMKYFVYGLASGSIVTLIGGAVLIGINAVV